MRLIIYGVQALADLLAIVAGFVIVLLVNSDGMFIAREVVIVLYVIPVYFAMAAFRQAYAHGALTVTHISWQRAMTALALTAGIMLAVAAGMKVSAEYSRLVFAQGLVLSAMFILLFRGVMTWYINHGMKKSFVSRLLVQDGTDIDIPAGYKSIDAGQAGLHPDIEDPVMLHRAAELLSGADEVVVSCPPDKRNQWSTVLKGLSLNGELLMPELTDLGLLRGKKNHDWPTLQVSCGALGMRNRVVKRLFDLAVAVPLVVLLSIPMLITALAIKIESRGSIFFRQRRVGRYNQFFNVLKFRSMYVENCDTNGHQSTLRDDERITKVGRFIRASSIDELPQLINVILGDMSLVGPRPHALGSRAGDQLFWEVDTQYWTRHAVKPGITGLAQIRGFRGATEERIDLTDRLQADLEYLSGWTLWQDIVILVKTSSVIFHRNAF